MDECNPSNLEGDPSEEDAKPFHFKRQASPTWDNDEDADSDYQAKPTKKKAKKSSNTSRSSTSKAKAQDKGKGKLKQKRGKKIVDPDEEEDKPKKKVVLAKQVYWKDIPNWGDRTDCPLLQLPGDVLDMCFGLKSGLGVRDYVALAGVSRYFRHHFTPDIFHSICWSKGVSHVSTLHTTARQIDKPETPSLANHIFSRNVDDWKTARPSKIYNYGNPIHYIPEGPREVWSEAQYIVYKEEQSKWMENERKTQIKSIRETLEEQMKEDRKKKAWAIVGAHSRKVLATVKGREDGEPAIDRDEHGLPVKVKKVVDQSDTTSERAEIEDQVQTNKKKGKKRSGRLTNNKRWTVPDTDTEKEYEILPQQYVNKGERLIYDHWPNEWRCLAVKWINNKRINKTEAMRVYKVTESELLCLKHVLVTNPMSRKIPQQAFLEAAVEALAWRSHGGVEGHKQYIRARAIQTQKLAQNRRDRIEEAQRDGTYVYKHKRRYVSPYDWWRRDFVYDFYGSCESDCEACARENGSDYDW
ncbi:hypothetical protein I203_105911 [Kwoniella mangroviensis CBS 8507]|uniref:uncharacterized protein n=1 Tax=Kwoniella mangroviensis CBS 8507 TaxID=1296122 RepID=UPI00080D6269|nr:uncharacterized protein I203_01719 [Kwoniella mangroviensis CBS 8507]OCF69855.1 hypothetical protein I203_01719 [Kwoniella mangroviensis CBS 8507]